MTTQESDLVSMPRIRMDMRVPLWSVITAIVAIGSAAVTLYFGQQRVTEGQARAEQRQNELATDIRRILDDIQKNNLKQVELSFTMAGIEQRVRQLEARPAAKP